MLPELILCIVVAAIVSYVDTQIASLNEGAGWNGIGSIPPVLRGESKAPMQHRVLVPWLCRLFAGEKYDWRGYRFAYRWVKTVGIVLAVGAAWLYFWSAGVNPTLGVILMGLYLCWSAQYDYADGYYEIALLCFAFTVITMSPAWALVALVPITIFATLNRETAVIIPVVCLASGDISTGLVLSLVFYGGYRIPRLVYGVKERYCEWITLKRNVKFIKSAPKEYLPFALLFATSALLYATSWPWSSFEIVCGGFFAAMLIPSIWKEIRVFAPSMLALIPMAVRCFNVP